MNMSTGRLRAAALALALLLAGCAESVLKHSQGTTSGEIMIGDARVSSRERLVNDRLLQDAWLKDQLSRSDQQEFGFQGAVDLRNFVGSSARVEATTNQLDIERFRAQGSQSADAGRRAQEQAELDNQLLRQYKQRQLEAMAQQPATAFSYTPPTDKPGAPATLQAPALPQAREDLRNLKDDASKFTIDPSTIKLPDKLKASPLETLRDKLEYRAIIRNEMLENALDDRHDLKGNTLLRFDLDAAVRPGHDTSAWAVITVEIDTSQWRAVCMRDKLYDKWAGYIQHELRERASLLIRNGQESGRAAEQDAGPKASAAQKDLHFVAGLVSYLPEYISLEIQREWMKQHPYAPYWQIIYERTRERLGKKPAAFDDADDYYRVDPPKRVELVRQIHEEIEKAHKRLLARVFRQYLEPHAESKADKAATLLLVNKLGTRTAKEFCEDLHTRGEVYAYASTPKETVQRIAEVASRRNVSEIMLALSFLAGNSAAGNMYTNFMKVSEGIFHAINRQPLVVGFNKGIEKKLIPTPVIVAGKDGPEAVDPKQKETKLELSTSFGWILGPRYAIKNDGSGSHYRHTTAFNSLSSVVSLPGWLSEVEFKITTRWVNDDGQALGEVVEKIVPVRLRTDLTTITDLLADPQIREPRPYSRQALEFDEGAPATVVIPGQNLWRNPVVLLGSQQADEVSVLPDMRGLMVKFREVKLQRPKGSNELDVLQVWTSEGNAEAALVKIKPAKPPTVEPKIALATAAAIVGEVLEIGLAPPQKSFYEMTVLFVSLGANEVASPQKVATVLGEGKTVRINVPQFKATKPGDPIQVQVAVKAAPDARLAQYFGGPATAIYYTNKKEASPELSPKSASLAALKTTPFTVTFPKGTGVAYPGSDAEKLVVRLVPKAGKDKAPAAVASLCARDSTKKDVDECVFTITPPEKLDATTEYVVNIMANDKPLPLEPSIVTITLKAAAETSEKPTSERQAGATKK